MEVFLQTMLNKNNNLLLSTSKTDIVPLLYTFEAAQSADTFTLPTGIRNGDIGILLSAARFSRASLTALIGNGVPTQSTPGTNVWTQIFASTDRGGSGINGAADSAFHKIMTSADSGSVVSNIYTNNSAEKGLQLLIILRSNTSAINGYNIIFGQDSAGGGASAISPASITTLITPVRHFLFAMITAWATGTVNLDSRDTTAGIYLYADNFYSPADAAATGSFATLVENFNRDKYGVLSPLSATDQTFFCDIGNPGSRAAMGAVGVEVW